MYFNEPPTSLENVCSLITDGSHFSPMPQADGQPIANVKDITSCRIILDSCTRISTRDWELLRKQNCAPMPGDVLLSKDGTIGRVVLYESDYGVVVLSSIAILRPKDAIDSHYLAHVLLSDAFRRQLLVLESGSALKRIILRDIKRLEFTFPSSKPEQTKIAEVLSTVDQAIEQTEALIAKQQRIKTGLMQDLLTRGIDEHGNLRTEQTHKFKDSLLGRIPVEWEVKPIEQKLELIIDYRGRTPKKVDSGVPLITARNVRDGFLSEEPREFISEENFESWMTRGIPTPGDVMFTTEAPMGNVARVPEYKIALAQRLITLPAKGNELSSNYLFWMLHWARTRERIELLTSGSTVVGVKQSVFRKVLFLFPRKDEQIRISEALDSHDAVTSKEKAKLIKLRSLKTALMQDLLTGKKRVTPLLNDMEVSNG